MSETRQHWSMGVDDTGDITTWENFRKFKAEVDEELEGVHLVSPLGGVNNDLTCFDHTHSLYYC